MKQIQVMTIIDRAATNQMLVTLAAGVMAGTKELSGYVAAERAAEALEHILSLTGEGDKCI